MYFKDFRRIACRHRQTLRNQICYRTVLTRASGKLCGSRYDRFYDYFIFGSMCDSLSIFSYNRGLLIRRHTSMEIAKYVLLIVYVLIAPVTVWLSLLILINFATIWDMLSTRHRQCHPWVINVAEKISMASAQGWHAQIEKCKVDDFLFRLVAVVGG